MDSVEAAPTRAQLDRRTQQPVILMQAGGHGAYANTRALDAAGVTRATPNPPGGTLERDPSAQATDLLLETATSLVTPRVPPFSRADNAQALSWALQELLSVGSTSLTEAFVKRVELDAYDDLADQGKLPQRVRTCIFWRPPISVAADAELVDPSKTHRDLPAPMSCHTA